MNTAKRTTHRTGHVLAITTLWDAVNPNSKSEGALQKRLDLIAVAAGRDSLSVAMKEINDEGDLKKMLVKANEIATAAKYVDLADMMRDVNQRNMHGTVKTDEVTRQRTKARTEKKIKMEISSSKTVLPETMTRQDSLPLDERYVSPYSRFAPTSVSGHAQIRAKNSYGFADRV